ncbi:MAG TPA: DsbA family protein [Thermomicrobiales bacterium]|jgi:protein-disulfide isomerase|nr:DsbA family protein [Thermomicrobiales bacterium]
MAKSKRQRQRASQQTAARPTTDTTQPRRTGGPGPQRQSITAAAQQAQRRKEMMKWLGTGLLLAVFAVVAVIAIQQSRDSGGSGSNTDVATVVAAQPIPEGVQQNGNILGDPNAPVLVVEYGDYQCPFCKKFAIEDYPKLIQDYIQTGKVRLEFRQYPIIGRNSDGSIDQQGESFHAAEAAVCAQDQGYFWQMHDLLYENSVGEFKGSFTIDRLKKIAALIPGMDQATFGTCLEGSSHTQTILASVSEGTSSGINSTPSFIVGDQKISGADYNGLKKLIDDQLAGK